MSRIRRGAGLWLACGVALLCAVRPAVAVENEAMAARYQRAAAIQGAQAHGWFLNADVQPHWITGQDRFWYRRQSSRGHRFVVFNARRGLRSDLFDHARLAVTLGERVGQPLDPDHLPLLGINVDPAAGVIDFTAFGRAWRLDAHGDLTPAPDRAGLLVSPNGRLGLLTRGGDLWVRDIASGNERRLTSDGAADLAYGAPASVLSRPGAPPRAIWSPDSTRVLTVLMDERGVRDMPLVDFAPGESGARPHVVHTRVALPGDREVTTFQALIVDVADGRRTPLQFPPMPAARMMVDTPVDEGRAWWSDDGAEVYFLAIDRGEKSVHLEVADSHDGRTRELFQETSDTSIELGPDIYAAPALRLLAHSRQMIWYSERSGWAHLYLYDLKTGRLIRPLTEGPWVVREVLGVDEPRRQVFISLSGRLPGRDPYDQEVGRVDLDTGKLTILDGGAEDHEVFVAGHGLQSADETLDVAAGVQRAGFGGVSPDGNYIVETLSTAEGPSRTVLCDRDGRRLSVLDTADTTAAPSWWRWPQPVRLKAADGVTDIDALVFRPSDLDTAKSYPVIDVAYGGPQTVAVPRGYGQDFFHDAAYFLDPASLAELGFVVVVVDGRGSAERSRAFRIGSYGRIDLANDPADHVAAIRQLAERYRYIDATRVGITGFSGGGYMAAAAMLRFPNVFTVGVAADGNHDQRLLPFTWGERYVGYPFADQDGRQANAGHAADLKGRLLLIHGLVDGGVNPAATFQFEQALIDANRGFDMLLLPRGRHQLSGYGTRRIWDYFVEHLAGATPPSDFKLTSYLDFRDAYLAGGAP